MLSRQTLYRVAAFTRALASVPIGGATEVLEFDEDAFKPRRRKPPRTYKQKAKREPTQPFKETLDGAETRRIRTKPRRRDYTDAAEQLKKCITWEERVVTLGKYVEFPKYDPQRRDLEDGDIDLECLPDSLECYNPFTAAVDKIDFSILPTDKNDMSREAKALRWTEANVPLRDSDLPIALRNPETREKVLKAAIGPGAKPKDFWKIWNMREPTVHEIDPWIVEQYRKLPEKDGKKLNVIDLIAHPRTLRAAVEYLKFLQELSEELLSGKWQPSQDMPDPPNPYRMEDYEHVNVVMPKVDPDEAGVEHLEEVATYLLTHLDVAEEKRRLLSTLQQATRLEPALVRQLLHTHPDLSKKIFQAQLEMKLIPTKRQQPVSDRAQSIGRELASLLRTLKASVGVSANHH